jgi:hypothetical protein
MELTITAPALSTRIGYANKFANCLRVVKNKTITEWTIDQLDVRPYQHILEIGYASGYTLQEVARKLKIGFLAGIEESITGYRQAYRRNKKLVQDQLLQLHIGGIHELPYPHHYFHTIYGNNMGLPGKEQRYALMQLSNLLKSGGRMVMIFQLAEPDNENLVQQVAEKIKHDYLQAGLQNINIEFHEMGIGVVGFKE